MKTQTPEAWRAQCLRDESEQLTAAVMMLAHKEGYWDGVTEAQVAA